MRRPPLVPAPVVAVALLLAGLTHASAAQWSIEVVDVKHRFAAEIADTVRLALTPEGRLSVHESGNQLVIRDTAAGIAAAKELVARLDVAPRTVVLTLTTTSEQALAERSADIEWGAREGGIAVGNRLPRADGVRLGIVLRAEDGSRLGEARQSLRVLSGHEARLFAGSTRPVTLGRGPYGRDVTIQSAGDDLWARPTALPDGSVRVDLSASSTEAAGGRDAVIEGSSTGTTVVLRDGDSVVVGATERSGSGSSTRWLTGGGSVASHDSTVFLLHVSVVEDPS